MLELGFNEIVSKIIKEARLSEAEVLNRIDKKVLELSGLVSRKGAAHIVANELGVKLVAPKDSKALSVKDVVPGLNNVTVIGRVVDILPKREFEHEGRKGSVCSLVLSDGEKQARLVFWNDKTQIIESGRINSGDILRVFHLRSKEGLYGLELHLTNRSRIELNPDGVYVPEVKLESYTPNFNPKRFDICDLQDSVDATIRGCLVQLFDRNPFYDVCPECGKKLNDGLCMTHGQVVPKQAMVVNGVIDDGTGTIRCVFFREQAEAILGVSTSQAINLAKSEGDESAVIKKRAPLLLGTEFLISGRVAHNNFTENLELIARSVSKADPLAEAKRLLSAKNIT